MKSAFETWFVTQFGKRESINTAFGGIDEDELRRRIIAGIFAKDEMDRRELWDDKHTAALYAWQAREEKP